MNVESGIPVPQPNRAKRSRWKEALADLEVGQSILFEDEETAMSFRVSGYSVGYKMSIRKTAEGWRVWRVF